jgi:hypothetical protein
VHDVAATLDENLPTSQAEQVELPLSAVYRPALQLAHFD